MIRRLYVHNFRCLENFELKTEDRASVLLIGKNGSGKSTIGFVLEILQKIGRGATQVGNLVKLKDLGRSGRDVPVRFEIEALIGEQLYTYTIALELPADFKELRVREEQLTAGGTVVYSREVATVTLPKRAKDSASKFSVNWHQLALTVIQERSKEDPVFIFRTWLAQLLVLRPVPYLIDGNSSGETLLPNPQVTDFGAWFAGLLAHAPSAYGRIEEYLKQVLPDLKEIKNPLSGDSRSLSVEFETPQGGLLRLPFDALSDGEKCFMICSLVLAANKVYGPLVCWWDEPDNYLALPEIGHFVMALRSTFLSGGQFLATSHHPEAIHRFSRENTFVLQKRSHLEPTVIRPLSELNSLASSHKDAPVISPEIIERLGVIGAQVILQGNLKYIDWEQTMSTRVSDMLDHVAILTNMPQVELMREIHGYAARASRAFGVDPEDTPWV